MKNITTSAGVVFLVWLVSSPIFGIYIFSKTQNIATITGLSPLGYILFVYTIFGMLAYCLIKCTGGIFVKDTQFPVSGFSKLDKARHQVTNTGNSLAAVGFLAVLGNIIVYAWSLIDKTTAVFLRIDLPGALITITAGIVFMILGNRIRTVNDKNTGRYLKVSTIVAFFLMVWLIWTGGRIGMFLILVFMYLVVSLFSINSLLKSEEFKLSLISPQYKIKKKEWMIFLLSSLCLVVVSSYLDPIINKALGKYPYYQYGSKEGYINEVIKEAKEGVVFPSQVDETMLWTGLTSEDSAIGYHYEIININIEDVEEAALKNFLVTTTCSDNRVREIIDQGINLEFSYTSTSSSKVIHITVADRDCLGY